LLQTQARPTVTPNQMMNSFVNAIKTIGEANIATVRKT
jgi:hypothetical protein